jgi:hypothetical protein
MRPVRKDYKGSLQDVSWTHFYRSRKPKCYLQPRNKEVRIVLELVNSPNVVSLCMGLINLREEQTMNLLQQCTL